MAKHTADQVRARLKEVGGNRQSHPPETRQKAMDMFVDGSTFDEIATEVGCNRNTVKTWATKYLQQLEEAEAGK